MAMIGTQSVPEMPANWIIRERNDSNLFQGYLRPIYKNGDVLLEVECGNNKGDLYLSKLCQGSRGPCILFQGSWLTPNEFQYVSGRENAKDWKRSIRHQGRSMKLLLNKGLLSVHPLMCGCDGCKDNTPVNRDRLATKRTTKQPLSARQSKLINKDERRRQVPKFIPSSYLSPPTSNHVDSSGNQSETSSTHTDGNDRRSISSDETTEVTSSPNEAPNDSAEVIWDEDSMDAGIRKPYDNESLLASSPERELKRESRLTSIIDQLLSTKTRATDKHNEQLATEDNQQSSEESDYDYDDESLGPDGSVRRPGSTGNCSNHSNNSASSPRKPESEDLSATVTESTKNRNRRSTSRSSESNATMLTAASAATSTLSIKSERLSPDPQDRPDSTPSLSPPSHSTPSPRLGIGLGPHPGFGRGMVGSLGPGVFPDLTGPPAGIPAAGLLNFSAGCTNYSDFIRGLAAKYNNNGPGGNVNDSFMQTNGFFRSFGNSPTFKTPTPPPVSKSFPNMMDFEKRKIDSFGAAPSSGVDLQTSQTLLNIVRSASAQSASQLESYLRTTSGYKRSISADEVPKSSSAAAADPLDLTTANLPPNPSNKKRPRLDNNGSGSDVLLQQHLKSKNGNQNGGDNRLVDWSQLLHQSRPNNSTNDSGSESERTASCRSTCTNSSCSDSALANEVSKWTVDEVCNFVTSVDTCAEYAEKFREQSIDGAVLPLLTEEHLITNMKMKLGPAIKLRSTLARKIGHCIVCMHCVHCHGETARKTENS